MRSLGFKTCSGIRLRKYSRACVKSSRYDFTVLGEASFSSVRWRRKSARASSMGPSRWAKKIEWPAPQRDSPFIPVTLWAGMAATIRHYPRSAL